MSVDESPEKAPVLRREALLPNERSRGLGTVAVVCTMAGVASGLALATTLMAMQVADSMSTRGCPSYRVVQEQPVTLREEHGFLGITYVFHDGYAEIDTVIRGTPAESIGLRAGDHLLSIDGERVRSTNDVQERIFGARPGSSHTLLVDRGGSAFTVEPTLISWPTVQY